MTSLHSPRAPRGKASKNGKPSRPPPQMFTPPVKRGTALLLPKHMEDPRKGILDEIGDLSEFELFHNHVLVAIYVRPTTATLGGMEWHLPDSALKEDEYQGTVGLVLKKGPAAFLDDASKSFYGCDADVGDWVFFRAADGIRMKVKNVLCRRIEDIFVSGRIPNPDYVY